VVLGIVPRRVGRERSRRTVLEALVDRQDDQLAGAGEAAVHEQPVDVGERAGVVGGVPAEDLSDARGGVHGCLLDRGHPRRGRARMRAPRETGTTSSPSFSASPQRKRSEAVSSTVDSKLFPGGKMNSYFTSREASFARRISSCKGAACPRKLRSAPARMAGAT